MKCNRINLLTPQMRKFLLLSVIATLLFISCNDDELCMTDKFSPNTYKFYMPYDEDEVIVFLYDKVERDTMVIEKYELTPTSYSSKDCGQPSESLRIEMNFKYDAMNSCRINYYCELSRWPPYLVLSNPDGSFQATYESINDGGTIKNIENFEFDQILYDEVIKVKFEENNSGLEEMV